ncbi:hypothetical protein ABB37_07992 [Leptomonas pyrrhocoris]|uniref:SAM-dependent MTase RsmB/NOP-type domain-containing protein n=1 Tax=Leptomonas pyrrhocoris TaxID=157538 RepID=A0A0M9FUB7_LEPPY|nr:hypothetical protein ABB37_07992 [Leptomonas pyrrhocoris]KPA76250.1 hypothetical protein ABB37_07992 [Leptomonas pyrrhocoris]|eukprot:XP_015654689.1 hypothetical protein ABB37_07992 [Leptomonas pyrrhocoris]
MRRTHRLLFDSFKAARGELEPLFSTMKSEEHMRKEVRQYIIPALSHRRPRYLNERLGRAQQRSLFRTNVSLVLQEARRRANYRVAAAALDVALTEVHLAHLAQELDPTWVKDAVSSCQDVAELRMMEGVLRKHEQQLLASGTAAGTEGMLLAAAFGRSASAATERGRRLGDDDTTEAMESADDCVEAASTTASSALTSSLNKADRSSLVGVAGGDGVTASSSAAEAMRPMSDELRVATALTQPPSASDLAVRGGSGIDASLWSSPEARAAAGLRRLQRQHRDITASPNVSFTRYFLHQGLVRNEAELMALYQAMRSRPYDIAFRVVGGGGTSPSCSPYAGAVHDLLRRRRGIHRVPWLPPSMGAYTLDTHDSVPHDAVLSNRHLLRTLARERLVVYQSLSSMLPVLLLDPQPGEAVLDLCASPGNKTGLILDAMHGAATAATASTSPSSREVPTSVLSGCVVANEAQASRLRDLQDRLRDVSPEVAVTRGRGQAFGSPAFSPSTAPTATSPNKMRGGSTSKGQLFSAMTPADEFPGLNEEDLYDGVLVDAPCSGEGRMGRAALSWRLWHPGRGLEFFPLQCALLQRAVQLCKAGGRVVYATCTLNPMENEAVVAAVLRACGGAVELVPPPTGLFASASASIRSTAGSGEDNGHEVPVLRLTPGLRRWDVPSSAGGFLRTAADAYAQGESRHRLLPEMFAVEGPHGEGEGTEEGREIGAALHRCCRRVMPHLNGNADGFFVAVIRKKVSLRRPALSAFDQESAARGALFDLSRVAAASPLAVSMAGGSNLLNDRGLVRLPATNQIVQRHIGCFFAQHSPAAVSASQLQQPQEQRGCVSVQHFLDRHGWTAMWCEGEGLRLLSTCAVQLLHRHATAASTGRGGPSPSSVTSTELLDAGVIVVNARGELTERGAALLRRSATSRVVTLPLPYAQLLLANQTLDVGGSWGLLPGVVQEAELALNPHRGLLTSTGSRATRAGGGAAAPSSSPQWCLNVLAALRDGAAGNAMVCVDVAPSSQSDASPAATDGGRNPRSSPFWAAALSQWSWPVRVEVLRPWSGVEESITSGLVRLHLTLSPASRHRTLALIGRLQGHAHRLRGTSEQQQKQQASATSDPSLVMSEQDLYGVPTQASRQHRQLLQGARGRGGGVCLPDLDAARAGNETSAASPAPPDPSETVFEL